MDITLNISPLQTHFETTGEIEVQDAPQEWRLEDGRYNVRILEWGNHRILFEILDGAHDGEKYGISSEVIPVTTNLN